MALKFPKPQVAAVATYHAAFVREAWVGARVHQPLGRPHHRTAAGAADLPLHGHAALSGRTAGDAARAPPALGLEEGRNIAIKLARGAAALHRAGIIHRDIKPDNVILEGEGSLKLIDLGVVRVPGPGGFPARGYSRAPSAYMAPEMFAGEPGNEATDIYALGVTMFRAFTGEVSLRQSRCHEPAAPQPADARSPSCARICRPGCSGALARAIAIDPAERFRDMIEFAVEMEAGPARAPSRCRRPLTLYERAPVQFWQGVAALLALALLLSLLRH